MILGMFILSMLYLYAFQSLYGIWILISYFCEIAHIQQKIVRARQ